MGTSTLPTASSPQTTPMSLLSLPEETLSQIVTHLSQPDRKSLRETHPSLQATLSPRNEPFWRSIQTAFPCPPNARSSHHAILLREAAYDYYIHKTLPLKTISHTPAVPHVAHGKGITHIAAANVYLTFPEGRRRYSLESDATALSIYPTPAIGLANGAVYTPHTGRTLRGHKSAITSLTQTSNVIISGSKDKTIRVRQSSTRRTHAVLRGHDAPVAWLATQEQYLYSHAGHDSRVKLWDITRAACVSTSRPGKIVDAVVHAGCVYAATGSCVHVLDARAGLATVAILSLPRGSGWAGIGGLGLAEDGALVACVGGGGVAIWDAHGGWVARGLGWPRRWEAREGRKLRAVICGRRGIVTGGGARELLTFARDGGYEGVVAEDGSRRGGVVSLIGIDDGFVVGRSCGRVEMANVSAGVVDWEVAERVVAEEEGRVKGFWE